LPSCQSGICAAEPLLVQGEVTRRAWTSRASSTDVSGMPVARGQNIDADAVLVRIDIPETLPSTSRPLAARVVADAQLANINAAPA